MSHKYTIKELLKLSADSLAVAQPQPQPGAAPQQPGAAPQVDQNGIPIMPPQEADPVAEENQRLEKLVENQQLKIQLLDMQEQYAQQKKDLQNKAQKPLPPIDLDTGKALESVVDRGSGNKNIITRTPADTKEREKLRQQNPAQE